MLPLELAGARRSPSRGARGAGAGRPGRPAAPLPAPALGRRAAARGAGARLRGAARGAVRRRADRQPRRGHRRRGGRTAVRAQPRARHHAGAGHARRAARGALRAARCAWSAAAWSAPRRSGTPGRVRHEWLAHGVALPAPRLRLGRGARAAGGAGARGGGGHHVGFLTDRAERALAMEANRLLGGDVVLRADTPLADEWRQRAAAPGLQATETRAFPSMLRAGERLRLSEVRALGAGFPLRGEFRLADGRWRQRARIVGAGRPARCGSRAPAPRRWAWRVGDTLKLGQSEFRLAALVMQEPDAALDYFNMAPRVFIERSPTSRATGLVQEGSRVAYRLVVAGEPAAVEALRGQARAALGRGQRLETVADARPEIRSALERAERFLGLAALIAWCWPRWRWRLAARRHAARHLDGCAMMRCLGASQRTITLTYGLELLWLGLIGGLVGVPCWGSRCSPSPPNGSRPGSASRCLPSAGARWRKAWPPALVVLAGFGLPPVLALRKVPTLRVLRRDVAGGEARGWVSGVVGIAAAGGAGVVARRFDGAGADPARRTGRDPGRARRAGAGTGREPARAARPAARAVALWPRQRRAPRRRQRGADRGAGPGAAGDPAADAGAHRPAGRAGNARCPRARPTVSSSTCRPTRSRRCATRCARPAWGRCSWCRWCAGGWWR